MLTLNMSVPTGTLITDRYYADLCRMSSGMIDLYAAGRGGGWWWSW